MSRVFIERLPWVLEKINIEEALALFALKDSNGLVVVNEEQEPLGFVFKGDIAGIISHDNVQKETTVCSFMKKLPLLDQDAEFQALKINTDIEYYIVIDKEGKYQGVALVKDLLEEQISQARERIAELENAMNSAYDGFCISDGNGIMFYNNDAFNRTTGLTREETIGKSGDELVKNEVISPSIVMQVLKTKGPVTTFQNYCTGKICLNSANPVFNYKGEIVRVITNVRDMTELIRLKEQLNATQDLVSRYEDELTQIRFEKYKENEIVAKSDQMNKVLELAYRVGQADSTVLITGESGVGKEIIANVIYRFNPQRNKGPFIKINCGALPENLLESELFGYDKGAFTGAKTEGKPGKFELANGGTLFLDEIGEMSLSIQVKLLRVLQEKEVNRLGGIKPVPLDIRLIAATNCDLEKMLAQGKFREDLYYRLNVVPIRVPPLRERKNDIHPMAIFFLNKYNTKYNRRCILSTKTMDVLKLYNWLGNIRELENVIENLVVLTEHQLVEPFDLPDSFHDKGLITHYVEGLSLDKILEQVEKDVLTKTFSKYKQAKDVAKALGLSPATVCRKAQKYGIQKD